ncbi:hypothetical protein NKR19_g8963 [Coniochaeta hoffmannii]|uniref:Uncharacterized protein n=1 Tax=Coniochaeta hoffmannii TaxID=91930 RepID=A0AA38VLA0_9PEZI|nr:hypothetical protein NKR19_g8963 [Coniochaeta hoffmannii]
MPPVTPQASSPDGPSIEPANKTCLTLSQQAEFRRLRFVKTILKSPDWELLDTIRVDHETHCFLARKEARAAAIDWTACHTFKVAMDRDPLDPGANWHRFFFGGMTAAEAAAYSASISAAGPALFQAPAGQEVDKVNAPPPLRSFGSDESTVFTFSEPERADADDHPQRQVAWELRSESLHAIQALNSSSRALADREEGKTYLARADDAAAPLTEDFAFVLRPCEQVSPVDAGAWRAHWRRGVFRRKFGVGEGGRRFEEFCKEPVSKLPETRVSALTERLLEEEREEKGDADGEEESRDDYDDDAAADEKTARIRADMRERVTRATTRRSTGSSAGSRTRAPTRIPNEVEFPWDVREGHSAEGSGMVYVPYRMLGHVRRLWKELAWASMREMRYVDLGLDVPVVHAICCNCSGVMCEGEFHCSACNLHKLCKDCSVGVPMGYITRLEEEGFTRGLMDTVDREDEGC